MYTQRRVGPALTLVLFAAPFVVACADDSPQPAPSDLVEIVMTEFKFTPARVVVPVGEEVTFRFRNGGTVAHEAVFGDAEEQEAHHAQMLAMADTADGDMAGEDMDEVDEMAGHDMSEMEEPDGTAGEEMASQDMDEMDHDDVLVLEPGERADVVRVFDEAGEILIGCHEPGHWEDGMRATVTIR